MTKKQFLSIFVGAIDLLKEKNASTDNRQGTALATDDEDVTEDTRVAILYHDNKEQPKI